MTPGFQTTGLQDFKRICVCCSKPLSSRSLVTTAHNRAVGGSRPSRGHSEGLVPQEQLQTPHFPHTPWVLCFYRKQALGLGL